MYSTLSISAGVAVTLHKKHPHDPARPLMDFDIALMLLPFLLLGVSFGWVMPAAHAVQGLGNLGACSRVRDTSCSIHSSYCLCVKA